MSASAPPSELDADAAEHEDVVFQPRLAGVIAEFDRPETLLTAAASIRDAGYSRWDTYTPFPVHGIDVAMGVQRTILPWIVLVGGLTGTVLAVGMQYYMNASAWAEYAVGWPFAGYQYPISGKPYWSLPANIPIAFELTVLLAAFCAFFGMLALNRLYHFYNPMFKVERFRRVTTDRFFLAIDSGDPKFNAQELPSVLRGIGALNVDECWDDEPRRVPGGFAIVGLVLFALALVPPALVMRQRSVTFDIERIHPVQDMDFQPKFKSQQRNVFFADNREMRPNVTGTIARGHLQGGDDFYLGISPGQAMASLQQPAPEAAGGAGGEGGGNSAPGGAEQNPQGDDASQASMPAAGMNENQEWIDDVPIPVTEELMLRGRERYQIYCAPCHGLGGYGDGIVNQRALALKAPTWVPVPSLHSVQTRNRADGYIYRAITDGVRKMPAYGSQIMPADRWAIVVYVRALQRSQGAPAPSDAAPE